MRLSGRARGDSAPPPPAAAAASATAVAKTEAEGDAKILLVNGQVPSAVAATASETAKK